jgi:hypothetical protein
MLELVTMRPDTSIQTCDPDNSKTYIMLEVVALHYEYVDIYASLEVFRVMVDHTVIC